MNKPTGTSSVEAEIQSLVKAEAFAAEPVPYAEAAIKPRPVEVTFFSKEKNRPPTVPPPSPTAPTPNTRVHDYEVVKLLGHGTSGSVFLGRDLRLGRKVAIKIIRASSPEHAQRFESQARTLIGCHHENIGVLYDAGLWRGSPFMVLEYLEGHPLTKLMTGRPMPALRAVELLLPVVRALVLAHSQGVVHRNLKPDNIFVTEAGRTTVLDLGIEQALNRDAQAIEYVQRLEEPHPRALMASLLAMAPEQWGRAVPVDHRADLWAVGIMLFQLLSGQHPMAPLSGGQLVITGTMADPCPKLQSVMPQVAQALAQIVDRCLCKPKEQRWPDAVTLLHALESWLPARPTRALALDECPYLGLSSFQQADADRFHGRQLETAAVVNRLAERPLIAVIGPSGVGKSSFVRAGVLPALERSGWGAVELRPGRAGLMAFAAVLTDDPEEQRRLTGRLTTEPGLFGAALRARALREQQNLVLFVDQLEDLYTLGHDAAQRWAFTSCLAAVADDVAAPVRVVLTIRSDFFDRVAEDRSFMAELNRGLVFLNAMGTEALREAIMLPAAAAGYGFETPTIVDDMLAHLSVNPSALPLMQFALGQLWATRDSKNKTLTWRSYDAMGGIESALGRSADTALARVPAQSLPVVRTLLRRLVTPGRTRGLAFVTELPTGPETMQWLETLVQARLIVAHSLAGAYAIELAHESLIAHWPTLKRWVDEQHEHLAFLERVRAAAQHWQRQSRDPALLWQAKRADEAVHFRREFEGPLSSTQAAFLDSSIAMSTKKIRRRRSVVVSSLVVLTVLLLTAGAGLIKLRLAKFEAEQRQAQAEAGEVAARQHVLEAEVRQRALTQALSLLETQHSEAVRKQQELEQAVEAATAVRTPAAHTGSPQKPRAALRLPTTEPSSIEPLKTELNRRDEITRAKRPEPDLSSSVIEDLK